MSESSKPRKIEELAAELLESGKATDKEIALLMARKERAKQVAQAAAKDLRKAQAKQKKTQAEDERKARTHRLIQLGGLVEKAGVANTDPAELLGWLLYYKQATADMRDGCRTQGLKAMDAKQTQAHGTTPAQPAAPKAGVMYLNVPIEEKDEAKGLGAKWDPELKKWYCDPADKAKFVKWWIKQGA